MELADTPQQTLVTQRPEPPSASTRYEVTKRWACSDSAAVETSDSDEAEQDAYAVSSPYLDSVRFLDGQYGIRRAGSTLKIGDAPITVHAWGDLTIGGAFQEYERSLGAADTQKRQKRRDHEERSKRI